MSNTKFTPGPWSFKLMGQESSAPGAVDVYSEKAGDPMEINVFGGAEGYTLERQLADARLIAAAPDLLDALVRMNEMYIVLLKQTGGIDDSLAFDARRAIEKATGGSK